MSFRLRLHSGPRQSGSAFGALFYGPAEAVPFRFVAGEGLVGQEDFYNRSRSLWDDKHRGMTNDAVARVHSCD